MEQQFRAGQIKNDRRPGKKLRCRSCIHKDSDAFLFSSATQRI
jgi:hypothetical protein